ncbi:MAG: hypothetical protein H6607_13365 [Flavobacteriales bacterium]|nr:hypothetical protein [Flavobacteriales bacterium]
MKNKEIQYLILIFLAIGIVSCHGNSTSRVGEIASVDSLNINETKKNDTLFGAWGNEPGWRLLVYESANEIKPFHLLLDYGQDSMIGACQWSISPNSQMTDTITLNDSLKTLIVISKKECYDDGEGKHTHEVILLNGKSCYRGCGDEIRRINK